MAEQLAHAASDLAQQLLATDVNGKAALAAGVAIASGGAAYRKVVIVREAFDSVLATEAKAIPKGDQECLRAVNVLSKPRRSEQGCQGGRRSNQQRLPVRTAARTLVPQRQSREIRG